MDTFSESELIESGLPCIQCPSSDAMSEYISAYHCFSCHMHKFKHKKSTYSLPTTLNLNSTDIHLPEDYTTDIPNEYLAYLYLHHFTDELIKQYQIGYSDNCMVYSPRKKNHFNSGPRLILPYFKKKELLFYEGKTLEANNYLKYVSAGGKKDIFTSQRNLSDTIVIVEDIISAIRVGSVCNAIALRGTSLPDNKFHAIINRGSKFIIWLDSDKAGRKASKNLLTKLQWKTDNVRSVVSIKDPKCYTDKQIREILS